MWHVTCWIGRIDRHWDEDAVSLFLSLFSCGLGASLSCVMWGFWLWLDRLVHANTPLVLTLPPQCLTVGDLVSRMMSVLIMENYLCPIQAWCLIHPQWMRNLMFNTQTCKARFGNTNCRVALFRWQLIKEDKDKNVHLHMKWNAWLGCVVRVCLM